MSQDRRECEFLEFDRRRFLKTVGGAAAVGSLLPMFSGAAGLYAAPAADSPAETAVGRFYTSLSEAQRKEICFPFEHQLRTRINANWHITKQKIGGDFYTKDQQAIITEIVKNVTSEDGFDRLQKQMEYDDGGIESYSVAVFGVPGTDKFEWELTGRHLTLRADGNTVDNAAFGGPIVYGHGESDPKDNLFFYQTQKANEVFKSLDADQAKMALQPKAPKESDVALRGKDAMFPGISVGSLASDQKKLVEETLGVLLNPYRKADVDEVIEILKANGGMDSLHMAFYQQEDIGNDKVWDIWRVEGPGFVWHFRGAPHVHAYINIGAIAKA
ncbi:MAG: DUF3500 domain-containing protein [Planctomycetaceae bacterium]